MEEKFLIGARYRTEGIKDQYNISFIIMKCNLFSFHEVLLKNKFVRVKKK